MNLLKSPRLNWRDRLGIIRHFQLTDHRACTTFGVTMRQLLIAYDTMHKGLLTPNLNQNFDLYKEELSRVNLNVTPTQSYEERFTTATKPQKENKKRGPKTSNIQTAFKNIPTIPVNANEFAEKYNVSVDILRQGKRFDGDNRGITHVKKDKTTKELMIWRDKR